MAIDAPDELAAYSADDERTGSRGEGSVTTSAQYVSPRLPPIASWLPHPHLDLRAIAASALQLPSPPPSSTFRPSLSIAHVPALALPGPARMSASPRVAHASTAAGSAKPQRRNTIDAPRRASAERSSTWTPEDESAANLLLHISSSRSSTTSVSSVAVSAFSVAAQAGAGAGAGRVQAETPSSLLGLGRE